ncbi:hypothetical protein LINGRAPRIM_LOCUS2430 [Linum grandiflorum]
MTSMMNRYSQFQQESRKVPCDLSLSLEVLLMTTQPKGWKQLGYQTQKLLISLCWLQLVSQDLPLYLLSYLTCNLILKELSSGSQLKKKIFWNRTALIRCCLKLQKQ